MLRFAAFARRRGLIALACAAIAAPAALAQNTSQLGDNGWYSDDTRADGTGVHPAGTNLVSTSLTDAPEGPTGSDAFDADIRSQITFGPAPAGVPAGTHRGAVRLEIGPSGSGKSQISHRKDDGVGFASGMDAFGPGTEIEYTWFGDGTASVTPSFKLGVQTADFGSTGPSPRTGEGAWDKVLIYEPGNLNGGTSNGSWHTETIDFTTGTWWFFDRTEGAGTIGTPMTLADMIGDGTTVGAGPKTIGDVYALITAPGAIITSVQFGVGSGNAGASVYVNQVETNFYRAGSTTTFGAPLKEYDVDATPDILFGGGNANGSFTADRAAGLELALRTKLRFNAMNAPENTFNSNGDGTYTFTPGAPTGGAGWVTPSTPFWNVEWSVNTDFDGSSGATVDAYTYEIGLDIDPGAGADFIAFDPIDPTVNPAGYWDHAFGTNVSVNGGGATASDTATYNALAASNNVAQNSWNIEFFNDPPFDTFDPNVEGEYDAYLAAFDAMGNEVGRSCIKVLVERPLEFDQNVTNNAIFGSGNGNGAFTTDRNAGVEVGVRGKLRFPSPMGVYNSNGDGTYTFDTGSFSGNASWSYDWSVNTDYDGSTGRNLSTYTYEIGLDFDPGAGTDFLAWDPITVPSTIPYAMPVVVPFYDHSMGTNATAQGAGVEAADAMQYSMLLASNNLLQQSWRHTFFDEPPFAIDPTIPGRYEVYVAAFDAGEEVSRSEITFVAVDGNSLVIEADPCQTDQRPGLPGVQVAYDVYARNLQQVVTGYQAFLSFDETQMTYEGAESSYADNAFDFQIQPIATANVAPGEIRLDSSAAPMNPGTDEDALLATLVFTVPDCSDSALVFDVSQPFTSEFSASGVALATALVDGPVVAADGTAPILSAMPDITVPADANVGDGCTSAVVNYAPPTAFESCSAATVVCTPPPGTAFPAGQTTKVTCVATDACGNTAVEEFDVTVTLTNEISVDIELVGVFTPVSRCLHLQNDDCASTDVVFSFTDHDMNPLTPVRAMQTVEIPCGTTTFLCVKDEQHTLWSTTTTTLSGTALVGDTTVQLQGGDTDNDGDVDINDVTLFLAQFGTTASAGGCGWDGTRDADFSNDGAIGSEDYSFLTANWLTITSCGCAPPSGGGGAWGHGPSADPDLGRASQGRVATRTLRPALKSADLNGDGWVDARDALIFERANGLDHGLSRSLAEIERERLREDVAPARRR